ANITVKTVPTAITGPSSVCTGPTITLTEGSAYGTWSSSTTAKGTISTGGVVTGIAQGTTTISYTTGCGTAVAYAMTVATTPATIGGSAICVGAATTLTDASLYGTWSSSNSAIASNNAASFTGVTTGTVTVTYN